MGGDTEPLSLIPQVSDNLKVSFLLPKLRKVNGKDASSTSSQVENLNRELTSRVRGRTHVSGAGRGALRSEQQNGHLEDPEGALRGLSALTLSGVCPFA